MLRRNSIHGKLTILFSIGILLVLGVSTLAFSYIHFQSAKTEQLNQIKTNAKLLGSKNYSALAFNIPHAADDSLNQLEDIPAITLACLYTGSGEVFAHYDRLASTTNPCPIFNSLNKNSTSKSALSDHQYWLHKIHKKGENIGYVYLLYNVKALPSIIGETAFTSIIIFLFALALALPIIWLLQKQVSQPITELVNISASLTQLISRS